MSRTGRVERKVCGSSGYSSRWRTPSHAFVRKMPESDVTDSQTGQRYKIDKMNHSEKADLTEADD